MASYIYAFVTISSTKKNIYIYIYILQGTITSFTILLAFSEISYAHVLEKPANGTRLSTDDFGISQRTSNASSAESRAPKLLSKFDASRKIQVDPYTGYWNVSSNGNYSSIRAHSPNLNRTEMWNSTLLDAFLNRRSNSQHKYPNGQYAVLKTESGHQQDKSKSYATSEDYEHQVHNIATEYFPPQTQEYDESYNTIPEDMNTGYEVPVTPGYEPWRVSYVPHDPGYFGPPIPVGEAPVHPPSSISRFIYYLFLIITKIELLISFSAAGTRECNCPTTTRSYECDNPSGNFLALVSALGQNLWALVSLIATSSNFLFQKIQDVFPDDNSHHPPHPHDAESRQADDGKNASATFARDDSVLLLDDSSVWDLRQCPSRVACEMGAFLAGAGRTSFFPQNLANYLAGRADRAMRGVRPRSKKNEGDDEEEEEEEDEDEEDQRDQAFKAFLVALGKKWSQEQCQVYSCAVLF
ncbi:hypothetical protein TSAR_002444 [Trichomalopsis sarcophagae]|uniref:Uncharacterized protein n=1 Tax=Trichomalopsis sarcophagae TaxID=543379 RepID=A0A232FFY5_9HYME|nr:hypothetical protein TSAR_002444 [Trichomalopsis sarcophagae]